MHSLYSVADVRSTEHAALAAVVPGALMQRAGMAAAALATRLLTGRDPADGVLVLAGPGNNGGDALVAADCLFRQGIAVTVLSCGAGSTPDAAQALERARAAGMRIIDPPAIPAAPYRCALVIDGLFGIGLTRPIAGALAALVDDVNRLPCPVLALDVPSGLDADTGNIVGADGIAIRATDTLTFIGDKPGLHTAAGRDLAGRVELDALGIDPALFAPARMHLNAPRHFAASLRPRVHNSHKGSYGDVAVIGGAPGMAGAAILAARAAMQCGAGRVYAGFIGTAPAYDALHPELMCRAAREIDLARPAIVIGPGLGLAEAAAALLRTVLASDRPAVIDADALNLVAADGALRAMLARRPGSTLLTPHPLEAARLLDTGSAAIQADRVRAARELAHRYRSVVVLKGSGSVIASPDGEIFINPTGNPALASGGTGDVLAGICGALLAQGWPARDAALGAVWLHGEAADALVAQGTGPMGMTAGELIPAVRAALNRHAGSPTTEI